MKISLKNGDISTIPEEELAAYKKYVMDKYPGEIIDEIILEFDGDEVCIEIHKHAQKFERTRRITGYLTKMDRVNDGKRAEIHDRVKHNVTE